MSDKKQLPYAHQSISQEDLEEVQKALSQPVITRGPLVEAFEKAIAHYCGAEYAVAFNSGTSALMAAYAAGEVGPSDIILSTPNTFVSTIGSGIQRSARPIFVDIDRTTGNLSLEHLALNLNRPRSRGKTVVVPVHFSGIPVDMQMIDQWNADPHTLIIEDAAHAIGSRYKDGSRVGCCKWSHMTVFSFHPAKTLTTGEGGAVTTNSPDLYRRLKLFRDNGIVRDPAYLQEKGSPWYYEVVSLSGNYHFTEMQAALGLSQLKRLESFILQRQALLESYKKHLSALENISLVSPKESLFVAPHLCVVQIDFETFGKNRADVMEKLKDKGIGTQVHYIPLYRHPFFQNLVGDIHEHFPETETYYSQALSLPLYFDLKEEDVHYIVESLKEILFNK
jgi:dTDP-4-amino-4,6-dideoxygalactose transaminase